MQYTILVYETEAGSPPAPTPSARTPTGRLPPRTPTALREAGVMVGGAGLEPPPTATTVRQPGGKRRVQDGRSPTRRSRLGGYYVIDVPDLDRALEWAARWSVGRHRRGRGAAQPQDVRDAPRRPSSRHARSYGRLLAYLAARWRDVARAEDAPRRRAAPPRSRRGPRSGVPDNPRPGCSPPRGAAWWTAFRHAGVAAAAEADLNVMLDERAERGARGVSRRAAGATLRLRPPAIDEAGGTPLMLADGARARRRANRLGVPRRPGHEMSQRLVRVKAKIREAGIRFEMPGARRARARLDAVHRGDLRGYGSGWEDVAGSTRGGAGWPRRRSGSADSWRGCCRTSLRLRDSWR